MPVPNHNGQRISKNSGGAGRSGSGGEKLGKQQKVEDERNPDLDPRLRVMEQLREFSVIGTGKASRAQREQTAGKCE